MHFLLCGLDGPRDIFDRDRPPLGVIRDYWGAGGAAGFDRDRTIMQGDTRLAFPASLARMEDGRVFLFDAAAWAAYSLSDPDRDGVPDGWRPAPILVVPEALRRRHPLDLLAEEDRLVVQPRIVVTPDDDHPWRIVFTDRDGDGVFETVAPPPAPATPGRPRGRRHGR